MRLSANIQKLRPSATIAVSTLAKKLKAEGRDILDLSAGEPDFDTPSFISEAGIRGIREGKTRYTPAAGMPELRRAIAAEIRRRTGKEVDWDGIVVTSGAKQALFNACFALFGPGDDVLVASPYWTSYPEILTLARAEPLFVAGTEANDFLLTTEELDRVVTPRTRGLILCSPSNPSGAVYSLEALRVVAEWARDRDIWLISDEIYRAIHFSEDGSPAPGLLDLPAESLGPHVIIDGVSKSFAMTGWRIGFSVSSPELAKELTALQSHMTSNASTPSQVAALEAYANPEQARAAVQEMLAAFRRRRDLVVRLVNEHLPGFGYVYPRGAFYLFLRVDHTYGGTVLDSSSFSNRILEETGVALVPGVAFGDDRYVRLSFATSDAVLEESIRRMAGALAGAAPRV
jgi:aspartate aminotransferase